MGSTQTVTTQQSTPAVRFGKFLFHSSVAAYMVASYKSLSVITERVVSGEV